MGATRNNSAGRLHKIFDAAWHKPDKKKIVETWSEVLGLDETDKHSRPFQITGALSLVRSELDFVESGMRSLGLSDDLYLPYTNRCRSALTISNLENSWASPRQQIREDTLLSLRLCAELLEDEQVEVSETELEEILQQIQNLRETLESTDLARDVRIKVEKHLDLIYGYIQKVPLIGPRALKDGFRAGASEIVEDEETIASHAHEKEVLGLLRIWGRVKTAGGGDYRI